MPFPDRNAATRLAPLTAFLALVCLLAATPALSQLAEGNDRLSLPRSRLDEPFEGAVFVTGHLSLGGDYAGYGADTGYGGSLIFRAGSSVNVFNALFGWNVATVAQLDYQRLNAGGSWTSADLIVRRHFKNRGDRKTEVNLFLGLGVGGSQRRAPDAPEDEDHPNYWTWLAEGGQEWHFKPNFLFLIKGQYRWFLEDSSVDGMWSVQVGLGIRWP